MLNKLIKRLFGNIQRQVIGSNSTCVQIGKNGDSVTQIGNGSVTINGVTYTGKNITIKNGNVKIDGKNVTPENEKVISITVNGNINELKVDACEKCTITGGVKSVNSY